MSIRDAADALKAQYMAAEVFGEGMIIAVATGVTPPPQGGKLQVIDVTIADGYAPPAESATGYDLSGSHYRVRTWQQAEGQPRSLVSLSS